MVLGDITGKGHNLNTHTHTQERYQNPFRAPY